MILEYYYYWNLALGYYSIILAVLGTVGNFIASGVCLRNSLRKVPTFVFYGLMCVTNAFSLYGWNINVYFITIYGFSLQDFNIWSCRITQFIQMTSTQSSSFLLVALTIERYLSVKIKIWRKSFFNTKRAFITSFTVVAFFFVFNVHMLFTLEFKPIANTTRSGVCASSQLYRTWRSMHTYIYSMIPFSMLFIANILLISEVVKSSRTAKAISKSRSMSTSVIAFTVAFFFLTAPHAVMGGYFLLQLRSTEFGLAINYTMVSLAYTFHGSNLIILLLTNPRFMEEFKNILRELKIIKTLQTSGSTKTTKT